MFGDLDRVYSRIFQTRLVLDDASSSLVARQTGGQGVNLSIISALREFNNAIINLRFLEPPVTLIARLQGIEEVILGVLHACTDNGLARFPLNNTLFEPPRLPPSECTNEKKNVALFYALLRLALSIQSQDTNFILDTFVDITGGLDPFDVSTNLSTAVGVGNFFGNLFVEFAENDGTNQLGLLECNLWDPSDPIEIQFHGLNYSDYTCYRPVNRDEDRVIIVNRWAPLFVHANTLSDSMKLVELQTFVTPGLANKVLFPLIDKKEFVDSIEPPEPFFGFKRNQEEMDYENAKATDARWSEKNEDLDRAIDKRLINDQFLEQIEEVIERSAALNDTTKALVEIFDNQNFGVVIPFRTLFVERGIPNPGMPLDPNDPESIDGQAKLLVSFGLVAEAAAILMEKAKLEFDSARPITVIQTLKKNKEIQAWGGPGLGTVTMKGREFHSYVPTRAWAEHPSFVCCEVAASAKFVDLIRGNGTENTGLGLPFRANFPAGSSTIEPGIVPAQDLTFQWDTSDEFVRAGCESRIDAGVSFRAGIEAVIEKCEDIGRKTFDRWVEINNGEPLLYQF
jgi:hypothetical protein